MALNPRPTSLALAGFVEAYGGIYEHSPWVAEHVFDQRVDDAPGLASLMAVAVDQASDDLKWALLRAHPELVGKLELAELTQDSQREQTGAGLDQCTPEEFAEFRALNTQYNARFGFPFIFAVKGFHRTDILKAFRARVENSPEQEFATALKQVHRIGRLRLEAMETPD